MQKSPSQRPTCPQRKSSSPCGMIIFWDVLEGRRWRRRVNRKEEGGSLPYLFDQVCASLLAKQGQIVSWFCPRPSSSCFDQTFSPSLFSPPPLLPPSSFSMRRVDVEVSPLPLYTDRVVATFIVTAPLVATSVAAAVAVLVGAVLVSVSAVVHWVTATAAASF